MASTPLPPGPNHPVESSRQLRLALSADPAELVPVAGMVETLADELGWDAAATLHIDLVLEEILSNIINYGYPDGRAGRIELWLDATHERVQLRIEDDGDPFDPFAVEPPDLSLPIEERPIGGLGIHFVRNYMDSCAYRHVDGRNQVILVKRLD